ncbi:MAG: quinolinate synthase [Magnetococcales bacterium]|nr:quinolinate synthase [Magnetococcales bacterium]
MTTPTNTTPKFMVEIEEATAPIYDKVKTVIPDFEWPAIAPYVAEINRLKKEKNAVILAHNYMTPDIFHTVADYVGDSLGLARMATETDADVIIQCGVHFMAETSKLLNPSKTVIVPDMEAGCSLASSITAADVRALREAHPGVPIVTYVNTSAEVKAECDICCTSGNAVEIIESLESDTVLCIPDQYLANWISKQTSKKILTWAGSCEVHERFTGEELRKYREQYKGDITIIAHPECPPDVIEEADFCGSTAGMINYAKDKRPKRILMVTECSMSDNVAAEVHDVEFIRPCNLCPHMKRITLPKILESLRTLGPEVTVDPEVADRARLAVEAMLAVDEERERRIKDKAETKTTQRVA